MAFRLPDGGGDKPAKRKFKVYLIGYFHIDIAELHTVEGKLWLFVAIDRTLKFSYAELHEKAGKIPAVEFLKYLVAAVPYAVHYLGSNSWTNGCMTMAWGLNTHGPGKPTDTPFIESFNGRFRGECLNVNWFLSLDDARKKIDR